MDVVLGDRRGDRCTVVVFRDWHGTAVRLVVVARRVIVCAGVLSPIPWGEIVLAHIVLCGCGEVRLRFTNIGRSGFDIVEAFPFWETKTGALHCGIIHIRE